MILTIIYPSDLFGHKVGGSESFLKGLIKNAPPDIELEFIGLTSDPQCSLRRWIDVKLGDREFKFFPVLFEKNENRKSIIPLALRFTYALHCCKLDYSDRVLFFNRLEPAVLFKDVYSPKMLIIHNDIERQIKHKGSEVFWSKIPWVYFKLERYIFGFMDHIYTVSQKSLMFYKKEYPDLKDKVSFLPTWVDDSIFTPNEGIKIAAGEKVVLFVGRLQEQKAPIRLIDTFKAFVTDNPRSRLIIIGEGNMLLDVQKYVNQLSLNQQVTFIKSIRQEELVKYYQAADVLLLTSNYEGMPMCVLEALGCGIPVVTTDVGEVRRVVQSGLSGEVSIKFDPESIAQSLKKVLENSNIYLPKNCIKSVEDYTPQRILSPVYESIRELFQKI